jgi:hypothetical protein
MISAVVAGIGTVVCVFIFSMPATRMQVSELWAGTASGNWLVVDCSGGQTMRHWVLKGSYVTSASSGAGWKFRDSRGNLNYVSGDAFLVQISDPLSEFLGRYKKAYGIPDAQVALE